MASRQSAAGSSVHGPAPGALGKGRGRGLCPPPYATTSSPPKGAPLSAGGRELEEMAKSIVASIKSGRGDVAEQVVDGYFEEHGIRPLRLLYQGVLRSAVDMRCQQAVAWCMEHMQRHGLPLNVSLFNSGLHAYSRLGNAEATEQLWETLEASGLSPNVVSFNTMLNACSQARDVMRAEWWFQRMLSCNVEPNHVSYGTMINAHARVGHASKAEEWAQRMCDAGWSRDEIVYNCLVNACAKAGRQEQAWQLVQEMVANDIHPNHKTYNCLIESCIGCNDLLKAEKWFDWMEKQGCKADMISYSSMIYAAARGSDASKAEYWMMRMLSKDIVPNVVCFNALLHAFARAGKLERATEWESRMRAMNVVPNMVTFNTMIHASATAGSVSDISHWLERLIADGHAPDKVSVSTLWRSRVHSGSSDTGRRSAVEWAHRTIIGAYERMGDLRNAGIWMRKMQTATRSDLDPNVVEDETRASEVSLPQQACWPNTLLQTVSERQPIPEASADSLSAWSGGVPVPRREPDVPGSGFSPRRAHPVPDVDATYFLPAECCDPRSPLPAAVLHPSSADSSAEVAQPCYRNPLALGVASGLATPVQTQRAADDAPAQRGQQQSSSGRATHLDGPSRYSSSCSHISTGHPFRSVTSTCRMPGLTLGSDTALAERGQQLFFGTQASHCGSLSIDSYSLSLPLGGCAGVGDQASGPATVSHPPAEARPRGPYLPAAGMASGHATPAVTRGVEGARAEQGEQRYPRPLDWHQLASFRF